MAISGIIHSINGVLLALVTGIWAITAAQRQELIPPGTNVLNCQGANKSGQMKTGERNLGDAL